MSNKPKSATPTVPVQGTNTSQGVQDSQAPEEGTSAPVTSASAGTEADAAALAGASGAMVTDASAKVGTQASVAQVQAVSAAKTAAVTSSVFSAEVQSYIDGLQSTQARNGFAYVSEYLVAMAPGIAWDDWAAGGAQQTRFYRNIQSLLEVQGEEFRTVFGVLLRIFLDNSKGALGGQYLFRFTGMMSLNKDDREGFLRIMGMLERLADPKTREIQSKTFDFNTQLKYGLSDGARRNILTYFNK